MRFECTAGKPEGLKADTLVLFVPAFTKVTDRQLRVLDSATRRAVSTLLASGEFSGKEGESLLLLQPQGFRAARVLLVGLGDSARIEPDTFRRATGTISRQKCLQNVPKVILHLGSFEDPAVAQATVEGLLLGGTPSVNFRTGQVPRTKVSDVTLNFASRSALGAARSAAQRGQTIAEGQLLVRRLAFTPANKLTPRKYVRELQELTRKHRISCRVLDEKAIAREKMGCLLAVSQGSAEPPRFVILQYKGRRDNQKPVVLIGKGVTFDAGGISLKPAQDMHEMKGDMTGSAIVLSTLITAARLKLPLNLIALMPLTENLPSGTALRPGDVITSRKGLTIEVLNTDAEGRLILADALDYASNFKPQAVVDIATLTGASLYVLGYAGAPVLGNHSRLMDRLRAASANTSERIWEMPLWDEFRDAMKGTIADLVNTGGKPAGTITASAFLENFVGDWPWAHIDIAYVDIEKGGRPYIPKGATGIGLRLLVELLSKWKPL